LRRYTKERKAAAEEEEALAATAGGAGGDGGANTVTELLHTAFLLGRAVQVESIKPTLKARLISPLETKL
jgi:hypothetical protein